jgi:hypothetical protein
MDKDNIVNEMFGKLKDSNLNLNRELLNERHHTTDTPFNKEWNEFNELKLFEVTNIALRPHGWVLIKIVDHDELKDNILNVYPMKLDSENKE